MKNCCIKICTCMCRQNMKVPTCMQDIHSSGYLNSLLKEAVHNESKSMIVEEAQLKFSDKNIQASNLTQLMISSM